MVFNNLLRFRHFFTSSYSSSLRPLTLVNSKNSSSSFPYSFKSPIHSSSDGTPPKNDPPSQENESEDEWWQDSESGIKPKTGDGGSGGGVVLNNLSWGDRALSVALDALSPFGGDMSIFALRASSRRAIFVRLDKLSNKYGCPSLEDLDIYSHEIKKRLDEAAEVGELPEDLGVMVSTPGADRLLKVPDDLHRFKDLPMQVCYDDGGGDDEKIEEKTRVLILESIEAEVCLWRLANVKENYGSLGKGRPLSRKMKEWRLKLPFEAHKTVSLYIP